MSDPRPYPRLVLHDQDPQVNAHLWRHALKNRLNALSTQAQLMLWQHREGKIGLRHEVVEFLNGALRMVADIVPLVDQVRELPAQPDVKHDAPRAG